MAYSGSTGAILSTWSEALKVFYLPEINQTLNNDTVLKKKLEINEKDVAGKTITLQHHYGRNSAVFSIDDGEVFADAGNQAFKTSVVPMKYHYGRVTFSGPTIAATRSERGAYARVVDEEIRGIVRDMSREVNRMLWGCGYGVLARWESGTGTANVVQKKYTNNAGDNPDCFGSTFGGKYLKYNGSCYPTLPATSSGGAIVTTSVGAVNMAVTAVDDSNADYDTLTHTDPSVTEAVGMFYCRPKNTRALAADSTAGYGRKEMMGLRGIVTDTDLDQIAWLDGTNTGLSVNDPLQGLATGSYSWWKSKVYTADGTRYNTQQHISFEMMDRAFDYVETEAGKDYGPDLIMTTHAILREVKELARVTRRDLNVKTFDGGITGLDFNNVPMVADRDAIDGEMYFLTTKDLQIYQMSGYNWMDRDGAILKYISGYDAYEAVLYRYAELGCKRRNPHAVIADLYYTAT